MFPVFQRMRGILLATADTLAPGMVSAQQTNLPPVTVDAPIAARVTARPERRGHRLARCAQFDAPRRPSRWRQQCQRYSIRAGAAPFLAACAIKFEMGRSRIVRISIAMAPTLAVLAMLSTFVVSPVLANERDDKAAVQTILRQTWDKPDAPLMVGPVVVSSGHAVAGWTQGDMGGRALLRNEDGEWTVMLCAGDALLSDAALRQIGLPSQVAKSLATEIRGAEASADPVRVAKFNAFQGIVQMESHGPAKH